MNFNTPASRFKSTTGNVSVSLVNKVVRLAMLATLLPLFVNFSLSSCAQPDSISPNAPEEVHSSAREMASVLNTDGFEDRQISKMWYKELRTPTAGLMTTEQHRVGKQAMRFSWKPSQYDGTNPTLHSELASKPLINGETERWYGYSMYFPSSSMANDNQTAIVTQWHGVPDPNFFDTVPPMAISVEPGNELSLIYRSHNAPITKQLVYPTSAQKIISLGTTPFDRWVDFVVHVKWDPTGNQGVLELWQDGVKKISERNISIGYMQQSKPYFKVGLYCWTGKSSRQERVLYYDDIRIGGPSANYDAVKPGRTNNSARPQQ